MGSPVLPASVGQSGDRAWRHSRPLRYRQAADLRQVGPYGLDRREPAARRLSRARAIAGGHAYHQWHDRAAAGAAVRAEGARGRQPSRRPDVSLDRDRPYRRGTLGLRPRHDQRWSLHPGGGDPLHQRAVPVRRHGARNAQRQPGAADGRFRCDGGCRFRRLPPQTG